MPPQLPPTSDSSTRRERILSLAEELRADAETLDLQEVDGEFYWRICREDLLEPLSEVAAAYASRDAEEQARKRDGIQDLRDEATKIEETFAFYRRVGPIIDAVPRHVWDCLRNGDRIPMRPSWIFPRPPEPVRLRIHSRTCSGDRVELMLARYGRREARPKVEFEFPDTESVQFSFVLVRVPRLVDLDDRDAPEAFPFVEVTIARPLPPPGIVGGAYDRIVRGQRRWHLELPGSETAQDKEVAIRTWAVALLMREGLTFGRALRPLEPALGYLDLSQEADRQARNRLFERVPEAEACLRPR